MNSIIKFASILRATDFSSPAIVNSFKTAIACAIGYFLTLWTSLPHSQWIVITVLVVMSAQASIGSLFIKSKMRFWGTVAGTLSASAILLVCRNNSLEEGVALFLFTLIFSRVASIPGDVSYVGVLGSVTLATVVLSANPTLSLAAERFGEISIGIIISFLVSNFILPVRSHTLFLKSVSNTLQYLHTCFDASVEGKADVLDENILIMLAQQRRLIYEIGHEPGGQRKNKELFQAMLNSERKIYRAINLMNDSLDSSGHTRSIVQSLGGFLEFRQKISQRMDDLRSNAIARSAKDGQAPLKIDVEAMLNDIQDSMISTTDVTDLASMYTFLSSARLLSREIDLLASNLQKHISTR